jgi:hypothetical protein
LGTADLVPYVSASVPYVRALVFLGPGSVRSREPILPWQASNKNQNSKFPKNLCFKKIGEKLCWLSVPVPVLSPFSMVMVQGIT